MRERMRPLISLWLDLLVLRMMNDDGAAESPGSCSMSLRACSIFRS